MPSRLQSLQTGPVYRAIRYAATPGRWDATGAIETDETFGRGRSDAPALGGPGAVVGDGGDVGDRGHRQAGGLEGADRRFPPGAGAPDVDLDGAHAVLHRLAG